ncbi:MAG: hypothetical protein E6G13_03490 [Actinobacteria bacterium]|nr:MAG: hypothetical protein E6G13_03490 [Actinomycetota bacterium]
MRAIAALLPLCAILVIAGSASATTFGITDDAGKYASDGGAGFFSTLNDLGLNENRVSVQWDPSRPTTIVDQPFLDRSVPQAIAHGVDLVFSIYPAKARALVDAPNGIQLFAQFAAQVARRYPSVTRIICLNEGNQTRFQQPQYDAADRGVAGSVQEAAMAACYDALKAVNPSIDVIGFGFSPRGNDDPDAPSNVSHSPLSFLAEIGAAYRASGRNRPIADDVSLHCYPRTNTDGPFVGFVWPNVGCANLDRFKQAWWDAFHGTAQPLFQEAGGGSGPGPFVRLFVDESGWQAGIAPNKASSYYGKETVPAIADTTQGAFYSQLMAQLACDPDVALYNIFHLVDESSLAGWQSGLELVDGSHRASYALVKAAASADRSCQAAPHAWRHSTALAGAKADFRRLGRWFTISADEGYSWKVTLLRGKRVLSAATGDGGNDTTIRFKLPHLGRGSYRVRVELHAEWNGGRSASFARAFKTR